LGSSLPCWHFLLIGLPGFRAVDTALIPRDSIQWQHAFGNVLPAAALAFAGTGAQFTVTGVPIARDAALIEAGLDWRFNPRTKVGIAYQGDLGRHAQVNAPKGSFTWNH
jgi:uncharacterized protein with beta-barrel porin domain